MKLAVDSKLWYEIYYRISNHDENMLVAYYDGKGEGSRLKLEEYLKREYGIRIHKDIDGRWQEAEFRDPSIATMIMLKYKGEYHEAD